MRVALLLPSLAVGGVARVVGRIANALVAQAIDVTIFVSSPSEPAFPLDDAVQVTSLPDLRARTIIDAARQASIDVISDHFHWSLRHLIEMQDVARVFRVVLSEHSSYFHPLVHNSEQEGRDGGALYDRRPALYKAFAAVTSTTRENANLLAAISDNVVLMRNPISADDAAPTGGSHRRILAVAGTWTPAKRLDLMIEAFSLLIRKKSPPALRIVGEVDDLKFQMLCREADLAPSHVELTGMCDDVRAHYGKSSIFAMTSESEGQPMAMLEAAAHGLPQVAYRFPGIEDQLLDGETGFIVECGDAAGFANRLAALDSDPDLRRTMGQRARAFVLSRFALEDVGRRWLELLTAAAETGAPPADMLVRTGGEAGPAIEMPDAESWLRRAMGSRPVPKVSVIVPVFGTEDLLGKCLDSLLHQTLREIEVIVVDDASPGNVKALMSAYPGRDARVSFVSHEVNMGLYQARSTGARLARGAFLAHVDSDDYVHPDFLRRLYEAALIKGADIVECRAVEVSVDGRIREFPSPRKAEMVQPELFSAFVADDIKHVLWNKLYRRSFWESTPLHMGVDLQINITEDLLRNTPLFLACETYALVDTVLYYYVRRETSVVTEGNFQRMLGKLGDINAVYGTVIDFLASQGQGAQTLARFRERQVADVMWYMGHGYRTSPETETERMMTALRTYDIFAAVAVRQAEVIQDLRAVERRYKALIDDPRSDVDRNERQDRGVSRHEEEGRLWELARAKRAAALRDAQGSPAQP